MSISKMIMICISLMSDVFTISLCNGVNYKKIKKKSILFIALILSFFHSIAPLIGYIIGKKTLGFLENYINFLILFIYLFLGIKMIFKRKEKILKFNKSNILLISLAISLDTFIIGITCGLLKTNIALLIILIFFFTFITTIIGTIIGHRIGKCHQKIAQIIAGTILIIMGFFITM